jgi:hypothetical protein
MSAMGRKRPSDSESAERHGVYRRLAHVNIVKEYGLYSNVNPNVDHPRWSRGFSFKGKHLTSTILLRSATLTICSEGVIPRVVQ